MRKRETGVGFVILLTPSAASRVATLLYKTTTEMNSDLFRCQQTRRRGASYMKPHHIHNKTELEEVVQYKKKI